MTEATLALCSIPQVYRLLEIVYKVHADCNKPSRLQWHTDIQHTMGLTKSQAKTKSVKCPTFEEWKLCSRRMKLGGCMHRLDKMAATRLFCRAALFVTLFCKCFSGSKPFHSVPGRHGPRWLALTEQRTLSEKCISIVRAITDCKFTTSVQDALRTSRFSWINSTVSVGHTPIVFPVVRVTVC